MSTPREPIRSYRVREDDHAQFNPSRAQTPSGGSTRWTPEVAEPPTSHQSSWSAVPLAEPRWEMPPDYAQWRDEYWGGQPPTQAPQQPPQRPFPPQQAQQFQQFQQTQRPPQQPSHHYQWGAAQVWNNSPAPVAPPAPHAPAAPRALQNLPEWPAWCYTFQLLVTFITSFFAFATM